MTSAPPASRRTPVLAFAADALLVMVFVTIGRRSHTEGITLAGIAETAWPFLAALGVGWLVARAWRAPVGIRSAGLVIWVTTVALGVILRLISGQGAPVSFIVVTAVVLALFLLGWRFLTALVWARRTSAGRQRS